jgi:L-malate glycosyltransferase
MPAIHQFVAGFTNGDAISNESRVLRRLFRSWGYESEIVSELRHILPQLRGETRDAAAFSASCGPDDVALLHLSMGSSVNDVFASLPCRKAILYHNVTPSHYFDLINKRTAYHLEKGRRQVQALAGAAAVNMADSRFNAEELTARGYRNVRVLPLVLDLDMLKSAPDAKTLRRFDDGRATVLFVGRCVPNKRIEDCLTAFHYFHRFVEPRSRFIHVGSFAGTERYYYLLLARVKELGLSTDAVHFAGSATQAQLNAFYRCADVFLCMSEHEGFCIPIIESIAHDVPVLAYAAGAVPETLDGSGVLFREKRFEPVAEMIGKLSKEGPFRSAVIAQQRERLARYTGRNLAEELKTLLAPVLPPPGRHTT